MRASTALRSEHAGARHIMLMMDHFRVDGSNGTHDCLVFELSRPTVPDLVERRYGNDRHERLPGSLA